VIIYFRRSFSTINTYATPRRDSRHTIRLGVEMHFFSNYNVMGRFSENYNVMGRFSENYKVMGRFSENYNVMGEFFGKLQCDGRILKILN